MKSIVSLEIGSDAIRAAEISESLSKKPTVTNIGEIMLPPGTASESLINDRDVYIEHLKKLWAQEGFKTKNVIITVSGRRFIIREHKTAYQDLKTLKSVLPMDASGVIPDSISNPILDFLPTHTVENRDSVDTFGLIIATPSEYIETLVNATAEAGFKIEYVDFAPMAIARFIRNNISSEESYVLANIREDSTDIVVAKDGIPRLVRASSSGLEPMRKKMGRHAADPEELQTFGDSFAYENPMEKLIREIQMTSSEAFESIGMEDPKKLFVTGPRSSDSELILTLEDTMKIDIVPLHQSVEINKSEDFDEEMSASDFVAICGGMRGGK